MQELIDFIEEISGELQVVKEIVQILSYRNQNQLNVHDTSLKMHNMIIAYASSQSGNLALINVILEKIGKLHSETVEIAEQYYEKAQAA